MVRDTRELASNGGSGFGIAAQPEPDQNRPSELMLHDSLVAGNRTVGVYLIGSKGGLKRTVVRDTKKEDGAKFGDGVVAGKKSTLAVEDTVVERSARAGFIFYGSGGSVSRSLIRGNVFAIDLEQGATPTIGEDNQLVGNQINKVTSGRGLKVAPAPTAPNPLGLP